MKLRYTALTFVALAASLWGCGGGSGGGSANSDGVLLVDDGRAYVAESQGPIYSTNPPTSGGQVPKAPAPGFYTVEKGAGALVNALFHSNIVIYYDPARVSTADTNALKALAAAHTDPFAGVVVVPRTDSANAVILTAWRRWIHQTSYNDGAAKAFIALYIGKGPMTAPGVEPYAIEHFPDEGHTHVVAGTVITYANDPPTSGPHYPSPSPNGFYDVAPAAGNIVHSMEHSNVVIYYDPATVTPDTLTAIKDLAAKNTSALDGILCVPRTDANYEIIAVAWQNWVRMKTYDGDQMKNFMALYMGHGPEQVPHAD
ncbi:MAG: DUF3105 domain-containing protein [Chthonomonadales bacterium]